MIPSPHTSTGLLPSLPPPPPGRSGWPWTEETSPAIYATAPAQGWPKLSIVCPSFQQGRYLEETIRSVLLQNYPALEFIIMDGGSRDETAGLLERYRPWLTSAESVPDRGQSHALNKGYERATGDLLGWINSDDYYLPGAFAAVAAAWRSAPRSIIFGDWCERTGEEPALATVKEKPAFAFQVAVGGRHLPSHATFWPRAAHQPFAEELRFTMDADLFKRLTCAGLRPRHVAQPLAVFRRHPDAKTSTLNAVARAETEAWSHAQPWHTHWRWRFSRLIDRLRN
jgi:hypothetical protein